MRATLVSTLLLTVAVVCPSTALLAQTRTVTIDDLSDGTVRDAIIDGFPGIAAKDGTPDLGGNSLGVALKTGVTEMRAVMEFPLAALADVTPDDIAAATLTFNIDDVLSTFGPGTDFNSQAGDKLLVHLYDGDGAAALADYTRTAEAPIEVDTGAGAITDATLNQNGAVTFSVDVRARLASALGGSVPFLGVLWRTTDSPTGTSIDNLGEGSAGPPGARSSALPFLTIEIREVAPPPNCGNGVPDPGETCDDGNTESGDCCSRLCQLDPAGTACSDGDACTADDACDGAGICVAGGPRSCDDGVLCTTDSCDPTSGCVYVPVNEGAACDNGDPCTINDTCAAGVCAGTPLCGNGTVDASCGEECDDGNATGADGCSTDCRLDTLLGGNGRRECLLTIAFEHPTRGGDGSIASTQRCRDNDPACDADPAAGSCGFVLAACVGLADPRLPACAAAPAVSPAVVQPKRSRAQRSNRDRLAAAVAATNVPGCSAPVQIDVPLKTKRGKRKPGKTTVAFKAAAPGAGRDRDAVVLACEPGP